MQRHWLTLFAASMIVPAGVFLVVYGTFQAMDPLERTPAELAWQKILVGVVAVVGGLTVHLLRHLALAAYRHSPAEPPGPSEPRGASDPP